MSKKIKQFDRDGNFKHEYNSVKEICSLFHYKQSNISACCNGMIRTAYNFVWAYSDIENVKLKKCKKCGKEKSFIQSFSHGNQLCDECREKFYPDSSKKRRYQYFMPVIAVDPYHEKFNMFQSVGEASKKTKVSRSMINSSIAGNTKKYGSVSKCGYYFYKADEFMIKKYNSAECNKYVSEYTLKVLSE